MPSVFASWPPSVTKKMRLSYLPFLLMSMSIPTIKASRTTIDLRAISIHSSATNDTSQRRRTIGVLLLGCDVVDGRQQANVGHCNVANDIDVGVALVLEVVLGRYTTRQRESESTLARSLALYVLRVP